MHAWRRDGVREQQVRVASRASWAPPFAAVVPRRIHASLWRNSRGTREVRSRAWQRAARLCALRCTHSALPTHHRDSMTRARGARERNRGAWPAACRTAVHASDTSEADAAGDPGAGGDAGSNECLTRTRRSDAAGRRQAHGRGVGGMRAGRRACGEPGEHDISNADAARRASPPTTWPAPGPHRRLAAGAWNRRDHLGRRQQLACLRPCDDDESFCFDFSPEVSVGASVAAMSPLLIVGVIALSSGARRRAQARRLAARVSWPRATTGSSSWQFLAYSAGPLARARPAPHTHRVDEVYRNDTNRDVPLAQPGEFAPIQLGPLRVWPPVVLAPMAGVTNWPFRTICRELRGGALRQRDDHGAAAGRRAREDAEARGLRTRRRVAALACSSTGSIRTTWARR
jgi:hypothetical protein